MVESENRVVAKPTVTAGDLSDAATSSLPVRNSPFAGFFGLWDPGVFDGLEEFVARSRRRSANRRKPPSWW